MNKQEEDILLPQVKSKRHSEDADKMDDQDEDENGIRRDDNLVDKVHQHNAAFPKMIDELDKRRSIADARMKLMMQAVNNNSGKSDPKCLACRQLKALSYLLKSNVKPRCPSGDRSRRNKDSNRNAHHGIRGSVLSKDQRKVGRGICKCKCKCSQKNEPRSRQPPPLVIASTTDFNCFLLQGKDAEYARKHYAPVSKVKGSQVSKLMDAETDSHKKKEKPPSNASLNSEESRRNYSESSGSSRRSFGSINDEPMV